MDRDQLYRWHGVQKLSMGAVKSSNANFIENACCVLKFYFYNTFEKQTFVSLQAIDQDRRQITENFAINFEKFAAA